MIFNQIIAKSNVVQTCTLILDESYISVENFSRDTPNTWFLVVYPAYEGDSSQIMLMWFLFNDALECQSGGLFDPSVYTQMIFNPNPEVASTADYTIDSNAVNLSDGDAWVGSYFPGTYERCIVIETEVLIN